MPIKHYTRINGFMIHHATAGSGNPLVMLHGGGTWHYTFRSNIGHLSRYFQVYAPDLPGHGYTYPIASVKQYDFETVAKTLVALMNHLEFDKVHLLGHSWGGGWAIDFAGKYPERVAKLILIDSSGIDLRERLAWEILKIPVIGKLLTLLITRSMVRRGLMKAFADPSLVSPEMVREIYKPLTFSHVKQAQYSYARNLDWSKTECALPLIHCPVLILWGRKDRYIDVRFGRMLAERIPDARLEILEECGHCPHEEKPAAINRLITEFLMASHPG